ncbi:hypothetical protein XENOCAPTIV_015051 [Xenoophorus captivus]|uniref:C2H2-type domain-containing protein n=1 Tax=Xenoophorus captivus TaxID=1517983 RepID=A0ABV0QA21_9TELE
MSSTIRPQIPHHAAQEGRECGDEFVLQSQLSLHMEEHRKELSAIKVYTCKTCGKEFKTFVELREHTKSHVKMR